MLKVAWFVNITCGQPETNEENRSVNPLRPEYFRLMKSAGRIIKQHAAYEIASTRPPFHIEEDTKIGKVFNCKGLI